MNLLKLAAATLFCILAATPAAPQAAQDVKSQSGLDLQAIDTSVNPCDDFYQYACGSWLTHNTIPADESAWGRFDVLQERNEQTLHSILEDSAQHLDRSDIDQKIGAFYQSCMNEDAIEKRGTSPLEEELARISKIASRHDLLEEIAELHRRQVSAGFDFSSSPDPNNARLNIANLDQGGLGLPEKDFYFRSDEKSQDIRAKYVAHISKMFQLIGVAPAEAGKKAATVMAMETSLAKSSLDVTARRDPKILIHEMPTAELVGSSPAFKFNQYFTAVHAPEFTKINVAVPQFVKGFDALVAGRPLADWRDYLTWHWVSASARLLPKAFVDENFRFYGTTLSGTPQLRPRWKRCVNATDGQLGEALGKKFVDQTFGEQGKQRTLAMVHEIESQMAKDIESLTWMSPATKQQALVKLKAVTNKIGYPDKWRDYSSVIVTPGTYFENWYRASAFEAKRGLDKIGKPVDRAEWGMTPPTVNAYYDPSENNINFPAGILQPPFYSNAASDAVNYGAVGAVIGHELTHGFDDEGRQFDADGNVKDWWQKADEDRYKQLSDCFVNEYGGFSPVPGVELNGRLTLGENTADNGGIHLAYLALLDDLASKSIAVSQKVDGYTQEQQFFLGFGQVWCENMRPEMSRLLAQTDPHSPAKFRVNGVVANTPEFSKAFSCSANSKMYAAKGCRVW